MSGNNQALSKLNKKDLYEVASNLKNENQSLQEELNNLKSIFKITGEGEFSPAILDKEYQEMLKKKLHFEKQYKDLQKKFTPDKDAMMIANKTINKLTEENNKLIDIEEQYEDTKRKLDKLADTHLRQSKSYNEILNRNLDLEKQLEDLQNSIDTSHLENLEKKIKKLKKENEALKKDLSQSRLKYGGLKEKYDNLQNTDAERKVLKDTIYEKDEYIKELQDDLKVMKLFLKKMKNYVVLIKIVLARLLN